MMKEIEEGEKGGDCNTGCEDEVYSGGSKSNRGRRRWGSSVAFIFWRKMAIFIWRIHCGDGHDLCYARKDAGNRLTCHYPLYIFTSSIS